MGIDSTQLRVPKVGTKDGCTLAGGDIDDNRNTGNEPESSALHMKPEAPGRAWWGVVLENPSQPSRSPDDSYALDEADYTEQYGDFMTGDVGDDTRIDNIPMSGREPLATSHDSDSGIGGLGGVESLPIRRTQVYEPPPQSLGDPIPKGPVDLHKDCDTCFGVVSY